LNTRWLKPGSCYFEREFNENIMPNMRLLKKT